MSEAPDRERRQGVAPGRLGGTAPGDLRRDPGQIRPRTRPGVPGGVHARVLETRLPRLEALQVLGRTRGEDFIYQGPKSQSIRKKYFPPLDVHLPIC